MMHAESNRIDGINQLIIQPTAMMAEVITATTKHPIPKIKQKIAVNWP